MYYYVLQWGITMKRPLRRRRPAVSISLSQEAIDHIEDTQVGHYGLSFSRALDRIILEHKGFPKILDSHREFTDKLNTKVEGLKEINNAKRVLNYEEITNEVGIEQT